MKNILIISYDFMPLNTVGANRVNSWFKYFKNFGLNPIVLTRKWNRNITELEDYLINEEGILDKEILDNGIIFRAPFKRTLFESINLYCSKKRYFGLRKIFTLINLLFRFSPILNIEKSFYFKYIDEVFRDQKIDYVIASGEPFLLFKVAFQISKKYNIPYVLDYRDSWSLNPTKQKGFLYKLIDNIERYYERIYLNKSEFYITVSDIISEGIQEKVLKQKHYIIGNGIDTSNFDKEVVAKKDFTIVYSGSVYETQPFSKFIEGFEYYLESKPKHSIQVLFVGVLYRQNKATKAIQKLEKSYPKFVKIIPKVSMQESIDIQKGSSCLLKFSMHAPVKGFYGGKLYEYYACDLPILNIVWSQKEAITDFFPKNEIQKFAFDKESVNLQLKSLAESFYNKKKNFKSLTADEIYSFSREFQTKKLVEKIIEI